MHGEKSCWHTIDDYADEKLDNGGFFGKVFGGFLKLSSIGRKKEQIEQCLGKFRQKYYGAYLKWQERVDEVRSEPEKLYRSCQDNVAGMKNHEKAYYEKEEEISRLKEKKEALLKKLEKI